MRTKKCALSRTDILSRNFPQANQFWTTITGIPYLELSKKFFPTTPGTSPSFLLSRKVIGTRHRMWSSFSICSQLRKDSRKRRTGIKFPKRTLSRQEVRRDGGRFNLVALTRKLAIGAGLLDTVGGSVLGALSKAFPNHAWVPWHFKTPPRNTWTLLQNRRDFLRAIAHQHGFDETDADAWIREITPDLVRKSGGSGLLTRIYSGSVRTMLLDVFPGLSWPQHWRVEKAPS